MKIFQKIKNFFYKEKPKSVELPEEFYGIIKLISGEEIFALVLPEEKEDETLLILQNPLMMKVINHPHGMHLKVKPWIEISDDDIYIINFDKVLTITETNDQRLIDIFNNYLEEEMSIDSDEIIKRNDDGIKITRKMGYISSVEEARKKLENIFKLKDIKES